MNNLLFQMQENYQEYKDLIDTFDIYLSSLKKIQKIINQKNLNNDFDGVGIDELIEKSNLKNKEIKLKSSKYFF